MEPPETKLPAELLDRATLRGKEWAWPIGDIPEVIEATRQANMISIGGQLQLRLPPELHASATGLKSIHSNLFRLTCRGANEWRRQQRRRNLSSKTCRSDMISWLKPSPPFRYNAKNLRPAAADPTSELCFVWYVQGKEAAQRV